MNILIEEIKLNKKDYGYTLLWFMTLIAISWLFLDSLVTEFFENIYRFMILIFFSGSFGRVPAMNAEKIMRINANLPHTIRDLFLIRLVKSYFFSAVLLIFLLIFNLWDNTALAFESVLFILIFVNFSSIYFIYDDIKYINESKGILKRILLTIAGVICSLIPLILYIYILKSNEYLSELFIVNISFLIFYIFYCFALSYYLFKNRKNFKN